MRGPEAPPPHPALTNPDEWTPAPHARPLAWVVCRSCATALLGTDSDRAHEVVTTSGAEAEAFRLSHGGHDVREVIVDG